MFDRVMYWENTFSTHAALMPVNSRAKIPNLNKGGVVYVNTIYTNPIIYK